MRSNLALAALLSCLASAAGAETAGYLAGREPNELAVIPQAPAPGSARDEADRAIFRATRALKNTARWALAQNDVKLSTPDFFRDFSCAVGVSLRQDRLPTLAAILEKSDPDMDLAVDPAKQRFKRPRPYLRDEGPTCEPRSEQMSKTYDYPSGHAAYGWATGLIIAQLAPDRTGPILQRARAYGESRAVCGVHSASAVEASRTAASALLAALNADAAFRVDVAKAHREMAALRASPGAAKPEACTAEQALTAATPW